MKLSCCLIIRDEAKTLERCLASIRPHVDELCILDAGSVDDSPAIAKRVADKWERWTDCNDSQGRITDFSAARNRNLAMATGDATLWLDGDDELVGGEHLRKLASEAPRSPDGSFQLLAAYEYDRDAAGRVTTLQWRERIVGPPGRFEWRGPVHEGLLGKAGTSPASSMIDSFRVVHRRREAGKAIEPERNLRILRAWFAAHGEADHRLMHYFAAELFGHKHFGEALYWFRRHIAVSRWSDERTLSMLQMARFFLALEDAEEAARWAFDAMSTKTWAEPYWIAGQAFCILAQQGVEPEYNYRRAAHFLERGMRIIDGHGGKTPTLLMSDPNQQFEACAWLSGARAKLGELDEALKWAERGLKGAPEHPEMLANVKEWRADRARNVVRGGMVELHQLGAITREAGVVMEATLRGEFTATREPPGPKFLSGAESGKMLREWGRAKTSSDKLDLVFFLGHQLEPWTPRTLERDGMGGSETMAWELSKRLAKLGHRVRVFAHCDTEHPEGNYDGVEWFDEQRFRELSCDVLIVSRVAGVASALEQLQVKPCASVLWVHDAHVGPSFTPAVAVKYDFVWCLSQWHRTFFLQTYPWLPPEKVEITRNGIDPIRFRDRAVDVVRNPHRAIYSSSPDRGLRAAVDAWPAVRAVVPDAELHCYYGFENWERSLALGGENGNEHCSRAALERLKAAIASTPGVVMHGRVSQRELADAMLGAGVWFYPTWFAETSCITAMEAQAAGLWCVCPMLAALAETVVPTARLWGDSAELAHLMESALTMKRPQSLVEVFSLDTLAESWQTRLNKLAQDATANVVPKFMETTR